MATCLFIRSNLWHKLKILWKNEEKERDEKEMKENSCNSQIGVIGLVFQQQSDF